MPISWSGRSHVKLNGFSHWLSPGNVMMSFDFSKEIFFATDLPSDSSVILDWCQSCLVVLNGSVSLISNYYKTTYFHI